MVGALVQNLIRWITHAICFPAISAQFISQSVQCPKHSEFIPLYQAGDPIDTSFNIGKSGKEEVYSYFQSAYERFGDKLHTTLVALGVFIFGRRSRRAFFWPKGASTS